jgi:hypothetical protein
MPFKDPEAAKEYQRQYKEKKKLEKEQLKEEAKIDKEITFPEGEEPIEDIKVIEESEPEEKDDKPKQRGRPPIKDKAEPPKSKMKYKKEAYKDHPATKTLNFIFKNAINRFLLATNEKLKDADMEGFGEALAYTMDYYLPKGGLDPNSPIIVLGFASLSMGIKVMELKSKPIKKVDNDKIQVGTTPNPEDIKF